MFLLQTLGKNLFLPFPSFWWLPAILGIPWLAAPSLPFWPLPSHGLSKVSVSKFPSYKDTSH